MIQNKLKEYRVKAGLTQMEVAEKLGFTQGERISKWEKGKGYPSVVNLLRLSEIYGVKVEEIYTQKLNNIRFH